MLYKNYIKGFLDRALAFILLLVFFPVMLIAALLIYFKIGRPILFVQKRPGKNGKLFNIYKFRTMTDTKDEKGILLPDEDRLTPLGAIIRKLSLDELPQLINVLEGKMSFVGPRPLLVEYLKLYNDEEKKRHDVTPGITGWAQVNGRNAISWKQKFEHDLWYVEHQSFFLDLKILMLTVIKVLKRTDVNSNMATTMEKFKGSK